LRDRGVGHNATVSKGDNAIGMGSYPRLMGDQHNGQALSIEAAENCHDLQPGLAVERTSGFIGEQKQRLRHQSTGNGNALLLSARKFGRSMSGPIGEPYPSQHRQGSAPPFSSTRAAIDKRQFYIF
jgi:hypothetical protein